MTKPDEQATEASEDPKLVEYVGYREREDYKPDPTFQYGTLNTTGVAGDLSGNINEVSPVFAEARATNLLAARDALDPESPVATELVAVPQGTSAEEAREQIDKAIADAEANPVQVGGLTPAQKEAATDAEGNVATAEDASAEDPNAEGADPNKESSPQA